MKNLKNFALGATFSAILLGIGAVTFAHLNTDNSVNMLYRMVMGREATSGEKSASKNKEVDTLVSEIMGSGEYLGEADKFVVDQYRWLLGRDPDPSGREFWKTRGPLELFRGIKNSAEYKNQAAFYEAGVRPTTDPIVLTNGEFKFVNFKVSDLPSNFGFIDKKQMVVKLTVENFTQQPLGIDAKMFGMNLASNIQLNIMDTFVSDCAYTQTSSSVTIGVGETKDVCVGFVKPKEANSFLFYVRTMFEIDGTKFSSISDRWRILDPSANG